jgi:hypothetical protein
MNKSSPILPDDCLKTLRVLSSDIFRLRSVKIILKLIVSLCSTMSLLQLYFFFSSPSIAKLLKCGAVFFYMCYVTLRKLRRARFCMDQFQMLLSSSVLLARNDMVDDIMKVIELWPLDTSDDKTKNHILKWSRWINRFAVVNSSLILLCTVVGFFSRDEDNGWTFIRYIFEELFDQWGQFIFVFGKLTLLSIALLIPAHAYQEIYITQHITFQIMLCTMFTRRMSSVLRITEENLIYDENYQEEIETKLKIIIDRHNDFLR